MGESNGGTSFEGPMLILSHRLQGPLPWWAEVPSQPLKKVSAISHFTYPGA